jgi:hypothetical protein
MQFIGGEASSRLLEPTPLVETMSNQNSIIAADAEAAELDATRAVYEMLKPLRCEAQTRVLDHVYALLRTARQRQLSEVQEQEEISRQHDRKIIVSENSSTQTNHADNLPAQPITRPYIWS